jgi:hypothetical protein
MSSVRRSHRRQPHPETTLDPDEQAELATKLRYAIGLEQLVGEQEAALIRWESAPPSMRRGPRPVREDPYPPRSDDQVRARAAKLGITGAGKRGQWLRR